MKYISLFLLAAVLTITACKEPYNPNFTQGIITDTSYIMTSVSKINASGIGSADAGLSFAHKISSSPKNISLEVTGLPTGATAIFNPPTGTTPFSTTLSIKTKLTKAGTYPIKIKSYSSGNVVGQEQNTSLVVTQPTEKECNDFFFTAMTGKPITTKSTVYGTIFGETTVMQNSKSELYFNKVMLDYSPHSVLERTSKEPIIFTVNCETGLITIAKQSIAYTSIAWGTGTTEISGTGTVDFTKNTYSITYTTNYDTYTMEGIVVL
ncbi:MAG: hypothetical protein R2800_04030 [Flavipsychrobacter sp.]